MAGEFGLVGALFGFIWVWLWERRDVLAEAAQPEACQAAAYRVDPDARCPEHDRPFSNRLRYDSGSSRREAPSTGVAPGELKPMDQSYPRRLRRSA